MSDVAIPGEIAGDERRIYLGLKDIKVASNKLEALINFLHSKVEGKFILANEVDGWQLFKTCREELFRKSDISIKSLDPAVKQELQKLMGEFLFQILSDDKQDEIISAITNKEVSKTKIYIELNVNDIEQDDKLFFPWEYMRCTQELARKYQSDNPRPIWISGEHTLFYRMINSNNTDIIYPNPIVTALLVDATTEQKICRFFTPSKSDKKGEDEDSDLLKYRNISFEVLGQDQGKKRAAFANLAESIEFYRPEIVHLIVDSFFINKGQPYLSFLQPDEDNAKLPQEFSETAFGEENFGWLYGKSNTVKVFVVQEWKGDKDSQFAALENIAFLLSKNSIPSTLVIPYHPMPGEKDHFDAFYSALSNGETVANAVAKLRGSFLKKSCYGLPIHYLSTRDFVLVEKTDKRDKFQRDKKQVIDPTISTLINTRIRLLLQSIKDNQLKSGQEESKNNVIIDDHLEGLRKYLKIYPEYFGEDERRKLTVADPDFFEDNISTIVSENVSEFQSLAGNSIPNSQVANDSQNTNPQTLKGWTNTTDNTKTP